VSVSTPIPLLAGESYYLAFVETSGPFAAIYWINSPSLGGPSDLATGTPGAGGSVVWTVQHLATARPPGYWIAVPSPAASSLALPAAALALRRRRPPTLINR
jgi:hypothetical protein